ncbi:MAG: GGDEF domain-containing protein [Desulfofustis sp.]|nr:GGDEF domain-containing protein [Desulfofustis sp.]MBT8355045.1 GGDEF domain-containing protein [Desulfofustis sp.]
MNISAIVLVSMGVFALFLALVPARSVLNQLPQGRTRLSWNILFGLILFFIAGYLGYGWAIWHGYSDLFDLLVPAIFFSGALFVLIVNTLSYFTALNLSRIYQLERENITDPLMGIYNRRFFNRRLLEEVSRSTRYNLPLSVLIIDIDYFKKINDTFGHPIGDSVLVNLGQLLLDNTRTSDIVARYGGEEIAIMTPSTPLPVALVLAERIRNKVETEVMVPPDAKNSREAIRITVSIGVASLISAKEDVDILIEKADKALYEAKQSGRNRVISSGELI